MKLINQWKSMITTIGMILLVFIAASVFDIIIAVISTRFYTTAAFITIFGVGGIFTAVLGFSSGISIAPQKNEWSRWSVITTIILTGFVFFFFLAPLEGGEYEVPFKAFATAMAASSLLFKKGKLEL